MTTTRLKDMFGTGYFSSYYATVDTPAKARLLPRLPADRFRPESDLIDSDVEFITKDECASFYVDSKRNSPTKNTAIVDYADLQAEKEAVCLLGELNEVEYSANINIVDMQVDSSENPDMCYYNRRFYYSSETELTVNDERISTRYFDTTTSNVLRSLNMVLRVDFDGREVAEASAKLKLLKRSFLQGGCKFTLTGSIEVPYDIEKFCFKRPAPEYDHTDAESSAATCSKIRYVQYWNLAITHDGQTYAFKVAVRTRQNVNHKRLSTTDQMNIECENRIDGQLFVVVFHALYTYYRTQYFDYKREIRPLRKDMNLDEIEDITTAQRRMLRTMRLVDKEEAERLCSTKEPEQQISSLVRYLGLQSYAHFFTYGVKYSGARDPFTGVCIKPVATCPSDELEHATDDDIFL